MNLKAALVSSLFLCSSTAFADTFLISPVKTSGTTPEQKETFLQLIELNVGQSGDHAVARAGEKSNFTLVPSILRIGNGFLLSLEKHQGGNRKFSEQVRIASEDEMDVGVKRLVRSVIVEKSDQAVDEVTQNDESAGIRRKKSVGRFEFAFGPAASHGAYASAKLFGMRFGYSWESNLLAPRITLTTIKPIGDALAIKSTHLGLGLDYYLSPGATSPYLGGALEYGDVTAPSLGGLPREIEGFALSFNAGYGFLRTSNVALTTRLVYRPVFAHVDEKMTGTFGFELGIQF